MQDNILYSYLDDNEKEFAACESAFDIEMDKLELAYEYTNRMQSIHMAQSELKVMNESGTFADLEYLYTEANAEAAEKKENIFVRMFKAIANFFSNIAEKVSSIFTKKAKEEVDAKIKSGEISANEKLQVEADPEETIKFVDSIKSKVNNLKSKVFNMRYKVTDADVEEADKLEKEISTKKKALLAAVGTVAVSALAAIGFNIAKKAKDTSDEINNSIKDKVGSRTVTRGPKIQGATVNENLPNDKNRETLLVKVKNIMSMIGGMLSSAGKSVSKAYGNLKQKRAMKKLNKRIQNEQNEPVEDEFDYNAANSDLIDFFM